SRVHGVQRGGAPRPGAALAGQDFDGPAVDFRNVRVEGDGVRGQVPVIQDGPAQARARSGGKTGHLRVAVPQGQVAQTHGRIRVDLEDTVPVGAVDDHGDEIPVAILAADVQVFAQVDLAEARPEVDDVVRGGEGDRVEADRVPARGVRHGPPQGAGRQRERVCGARDRPGGRHQTVFQLHQSRAKGVRTPPRLRG